MSLTEKLTDYVGACFCGLWVETCEPDEALIEIGRMCSQQNWRLAVWDIMTGVTVGDASPGSDPVAVGDPLAALSALASMADQKSTVLMVLRNFHRFANNVEIVQSLQRQILAGKHQRAFVVVFAPTSEIPVELQNQFIVIEHPLPNRDQIREIAESLIGGETGFPPIAQPEVVIDAASGLTRYEAEGAFSLSIVRHNEITPESIWELKRQQLKKNGLLQMVRGEQSFDSIGGLESLKSFCKRALESRHPKARPRGVFLVGVPGSGKSFFAKCLGFETQRPTLILDVGALMASLVGQTEQNIRRALATVDAMAPCVLMIDEVEKALSGVGSSGSTDSGVTARMFGTFLTWLNDHTSEVFTIATCNDISKLPPEFSRAERFDGVFFVDLPSELERSSIWQIAGSEFELDVSKSRPKDATWTGAEIHACCRLAALLNVSLIDAAQQIVPIATLAESSVDKLRNWASGRCLDASRPGIYTINGASTATTRRKLREVGPKPSDN